MKVEKTEQGQCHGRARKEEEEERDDVCSGSGQEVIPLIPGGQHQSDGGSDRIWQFALVLSQRPARALRKEQASEGEAKRKEMHH